LAKFLKKYGLSCRKTRKKTLMELYSELYYDSKFKEDVAKEVQETKPIEDETKKQFKARRMRIYQKWRKIAWAAESEEVKEEIQTLHAQPEGLGDEDIGGNLLDDNKCARGGSNAQWCVYSRSIYRYISTFC
jgi:hypothetical protein